VLQTTGFTENPRGVKIRYKLVQTGVETNSPRIFVVKELKDGREFSG